MNNTMLKKINEIEWQKISKENQNILDNHLKDIYGDSLKNKEEYYYSFADDSSNSTNFDISEDEEGLIALFSKH